MVMYFSLRGAPSPHLHATMDSIRNPPSSFSVSVRFLCFFFSEDPRKERSPSPRAPQRRRAPPLRGFGVKAIKGGTCMLRAPQSSARHFASLADVYRNLRKIILASGAFHLSGFEIVSTDKKLFYLNFSCSRGRHTILTHLTRTS